MLALQPETSGYRAPTTPSNGGLPGDCQETTGTNIAPTVLSPEKDAKCVPCVHGFLSCILGMFYFPQDTRTQNNDNRAELNDLEEAC